MIKVEQMTKSYPLVGLRRHYVFRRLDLDLPSRTNVGIIGRNGVGKSTLLRLVGGIEYPDAGRITIDGSVSPPLGLTSGFAQNLSARDNARFACRIYGLTEAEMGERVDFIESFADIGEFFRYPVQTYSSGMRARLAFAISMAFEYDYYLIDELTAVGDQRFRERAADAFKQKRGQASIIIVSHNLGQLKQDCDVGIYLRQGQALYFDKMADAIDAYSKDNQ